MAFLGDLWVNWFTARNNDLPYGCESWENRWKYRNLQLNWMQSVQDVLVFLAEHEPAPRNLSFSIPKAGGSNLIKR